MFEQKRMSRKWNKHFSCV